MVDGKVFIFASFALLHRQTNQTKKRKFYANFPPMKIFTSTKMFFSRVLFKDPNVRESTMHVLVVYSYFVLEMFEEFRRKEMSGVRGGRWLVSEQTRSSMLLCATPATYHQSWNIKRDSTELRRGIIVQWYAIYFLIKAEIPNIQKNAEGSTQKSLTRDARNAHQLMHNYI